MVLLNHLTVFVMKPKKIIKSVSKADLAKARGKRQEHSTRDYPKFLNQLEHVVSTFRNLGYDLYAKKSAGTDDRGGGRKK